MRAMVFDRYGEPDIMGLREVPVPEPQDGEVLIRVGYAGVNPADSKTRAGLGTRAGVAFPFVTSMDAAGVVEQTGRMSPNSVQEIGSSLGAEFTARRGALMRNSFVFP
jgi:NADPH:quinone reductase-like Zn-dependent oxidoreductase